MTQKKLGQLWHVEKREKEQMFGISSIHSLNFNS